MREISSLARRMQVNRLGVYLTATLIALVLSSSSGEIPTLAEERTTHKTDETPSSAKTGEMPAEGEERPQSDHPRSAIDHPLGSGRLKGAAQELRMKEFVKALDSRMKEGGSFRAVYENFVDDLGAKRMIDYFEQKNASCHGELHDLGALLMERTNNLETSVGLCGNGCTYACIHGALGAYLSRYRTDGAVPSASVEKEVKLSSPMEELKQEVNHLCREDSKLVKDFFRGNCAHAVGHGFAQLTRNLPEAQERCGYFETLPMRYYCESGLFMELGESIEDNLYKGEMTPKDEAEAAVDYCAQNTERPSACLRFLLGQAKNRKEIAVVARKCAGLGGKARRGCFNALGFHSRAYVAAHPKEINNVCQQRDPTDQRLCISGLSFVKKGHSLKKALLSACEQFKNREFRELCKEQHRRFYYQLDNPVISLMFVDG